MARRNRQLLTDLFRSLAGHTSLWMKDVPFFFLHREYDNIREAGIAANSRSCYIT